MRGGGAYPNVQKGGKSPNNIVFPPKKEIQISKETREKAEIAKMYIQGNIMFLTINKKNIKNYWKMRKKRRNIGTN